MKGIKNNMNKKTKLIIIISCILVVLLVALFLIFSKKDETNDSKYGNYSEKEYKEVEALIDTIIDNGPKTSSIPFDYINASEEEYNKLLSTPELTFQYAISDLINTNGGNGLRSYIEVLLCNEININFKIGFSNANEWLEKYKEYLNKSGKDFNSYDSYARKLLGIIA